MFVLLLILSVNAADFSLNPTYMIFQFVTISSKKKSRNNVQSKNEVYSVNYSVFTINV